MDEAIKWLREQVTQRLETAREACHGNDGRWVGREETRYGPHGHLRDSEGEVVVYDEGSPSDAEFEHIALNDPQDVIARCEAELAIVTRCEAIRADPERGLWPDVTRRERTHASATLHDIAASYRHRDGYAEHWGQS